MNHSCTHRRTHISIQTYHVFPAFPRISFSLQRSIFEELFAKESRQKDQIRSASQTLTEASEKKTAEELEEQSSPTVLLRPPFFVLEPIVPPVLWISGTSSVSCPAKTKGLDPAFLTSTSFLQLLYFRHRPYRPCSRQSPSYPTRAASTDGGVEWRTSCQTRAKKIQRACLHQCLQ